MDNSGSKIVFDEKLNIEVLTLTGMIESLPPHFHDYYELGYIESGSRRVICQGKEYIIGKNDLLLFNPKDNHTCLELKKEMLDFTALAQSSPGAIAVNAAILVGWKICGFAGMLVAVLGTILPPMIILSVISFFYAVFVNNIWVAVVLKGMQAAVAAVILDAACDLGINAAKEKSILSGIIFIAAFVCDFIFQLNVIYIILAAVVLGIIKTFILRYREMKS